MWGCLWGRMIHIHVLFFHHQLQNWLLAPSGRFLPSPAALLCSPWGVPVSRGCILCLSVLNLMFRYNCSSLAFLTAAAWQKSMNFYKLFMNLFLLNIKKKPIKINMLGAVIRGLCYLLQLVAWCCKLSRQWGCLEGWNQFSGEQFSGLVLVYKLLTFLKKFTLWCLMGSLEKGTRTSKTDTKLVNKNSASGTISTQGWRPWVRETCCAAWKCKNCLCQEIVLPGINDCFLITAFSLQLLLVFCIYVCLDG